MIAQTIAQAKERSPESLWHFLQQLPSTMEAQLLYGLILAGAVGAIGSWFVKWARYQAGPLHTYFYQEIRSTILAASGFLGICLTAISSGIFVADGGAFVGWANVLWFGLTNGFGADMVVNKGGQRAGNQNSGGTI